MSLWVHSYSVARFKPCFAASNAQSLSNISRSELKDSKTNLVKIEEVQIWNAMSQVWRHQTSQRVEHRYIWNRKPWETPPTWAEGKREPPLQDCRTPQALSSAACPCWCKHQKLSCGETASQSSADTSSREHWVYFAGPVGIVHTCAPGPTRKIPPRWAVHTQSCSTALFVLTYWT